MRPRELTREDVAAVLRAHPTCSPHDVPFYLHNNGLLSLNYNLRRHQIQWAISMANRLRREMREGKGSEFMTVEWDDTNKDLCRLAAKRVGDALQSVLQLCKTPQEVLSVSVYAMSPVVGAACGSYAALAGIEKADVVTKDLMCAVLDLMDEATAEDAAQS